MRERVEKRGREKGVLSTSLSFSYFSFSSVPSISSTIVFIHGCLLVLLILHRLTIHASEKLVLLVFIPPPPARKRLFLNIFFLFFHYSSFFFLRNTRNLRIDYCNRNFYHRDIVRRVFDGYWVTVVSLYDKHFIMLLLKRMCVYIII